MFPTPKHVEIEGLKIRYVDNEVSWSTSIVLLSPWPESLYAYAAIWDRLSVRARMVAFDLPGMGLSEGRPELMFPSTMADFVLGALKTFRLDRPHAIGPDVGTSILPFAALSAPDAFKSLIIGGGAAGHEDVGGDLYDLIHDETGGFFSKASGEAFVRGAASGLDRYKLPDEILNDYIASYSGERFRNSAEFLRNYRTDLPMLERRLGEIRPPVCLIAGAKDPFVSIRNAQTLHKALTGSELNILDAGHFVWEDRAEEYADIVEAWIAKTA